MSDFLAFWLKGFFAPYAAAAYAVFALRLWTQRVSRKEWLVLAFFLGHHALQVAQLWLGDGTLNDLNYRIRYFNPLAPLLWVWAGYGLWRLWQGGGAWRRPLRVALALGVALLAAYELPFRTAKQVLEGSRAETRRAGEAFAPIIRADWKGPATIPGYRRDPQRYVLNRRPTLGPGWDNSAWPLRRQSLGIGLVPTLPLPDYYVTYEALPPHLAPRYTLLATQPLRKRTFRLYRRNPDPAKPTP